MIRPRLIWTAIALIAVSLSVSASLLGQTLARPGWVGSGLTAQSWFKHAIFYQIDTRTFASSKAEADATGHGDLKGITQRLDYIHALGVDAILLKPVSPASRPTSIDPTLGTLDDLDDLTLQASRFKVRVLVELPTPDPVAARFWLTRGIAGLYISGSAPANFAESIRKLLATYVGQRVLITDADFAAGKLSPYDLLLDRVVVQSTPNPAPGLRTALEQSQILFHSGTPILAVGMAATPSPQLARILATVALLNRSATVIFAGQELGFSPPSGSDALMPWGQPAIFTPEEPAEPARPAAPRTSSPEKYRPYVPYIGTTAAASKSIPPDPATAAGQDADPKSLLNFYRELGRLHHGNTGLRDGEEITFNHDESNALIWIRKPRSPSQLNPAALIACNLSDKPVVLSLKADVARLQLRGTFLRTILRSDDLMGGISLDPITLPPYGVYVGSLRY